MVRMLIKTIWLWVIAAFWTAFGTVAYAGPPFSCDGSIYQVQSGQLRIFDPITSTYQNVGARNSSYNATGYNTLDNYAYASQGQNLIQISSDGTIDVVHNLGFGSFSGDVDFSNNYWLRRNNTRYARIDIATGNSVDVNFTAVGGGTAPGGGPADVAYDQFNGDEYLIGFSGGGTLYRYNITDNTKENISISGLPSGAYGATWTDSLGRLFTFSNNNGLLYEVTNYYTNSPTFTQVGVGVPSGSNDGFSCSQAPFPNLAPLAFDDEITTDVNMAVSGNVLADNGNGADTDPNPNSGTLTVNETPVSGPSNGTLILNDDGTFTYTPDLNFFGTDVFEYEVTDQFGVTTTAFVFIMVEADPDFTISKTQVSGPTTAENAGDILNYQIVLENTGDVPLTDVQVSDTLPNGATGTLAGPVESNTGLTVTPNALDVNETWQYTISYTVTQDDIDAGANLVNTAQATTDETGALAKSNTAVTPVLQDPLLTIDKIVDATTTNVPGTLTYTIEIENTGNQTLTGVVFTDAPVQNGATLPLASGPDLTGDVGNDNEIAVDEVWTYTVTVAVTQAQLDLGADIVNTATITTDQTAAQSDGAVTSISRMPSFTLAKTSDTATISAPGTITYTIEINNTGNTSVTGVTPTDTLTQGATTLALTSGLDLSGDADGDGALGPTETWFYTGTFDVTQDEIDNGVDDIVNSVSVATTNAGTLVSSTPTVVTQTPLFTVTKTANPTDLSATGTVTYEVIVTNTGNVSLTGVGLTDTLTQTGPLAFTTGPTLSGDTIDPGVLNVGEAWVYTSTFDVEQDQIDDGTTLTNVADVDTDQTGVVSANATTTITQTDEVTLAKVIAAGEPTSFSAVGDTIDFDYTVTNTGNTTLIGPITIDDDQIQPVQTCFAGNIAPGDSETCTLTWTADQLDLNAGAVTNIATASDSNPVTPIKSAPQQQTVTAVQNPVLGIAKTIVDEPLRPEPSVFQSGETLYYDYVVTNNGNVTLTQQITVTDNLVTVAPNAVNCPAPPVGGLLPGASITCDATYVISDSDISLGSTANTASAETTFDGATVVSPTATAVFPVGLDPVLELDKTAPSGLVIDTVGQEIIYSYTITNVPPTASVAAVLVNEIFINDDKFANPISCYDPATDGGDFGPNDTFTCTATYEVTQADLDAGEVVNEATANTVFAEGAATPVDVTSNVDTVTVPTAGEPELTVMKTVIGGPNSAAVGDDINYQIVATNTGNQTLTNVVITDPDVGALTCDIAAPVTLTVDPAAGSALTCTGTYTVQQADLDAQTVGVPGTAVFTNTATAVANDPAGDAITPADGSVDHPLDPVVPSVAILKELFPDPLADPAYTAVDDIVRFRMTVTNDGDMTLSSIDVTDSLVSGICTVGPLAPGDTDTTCVFDYTVVQADLDNGFIENTGTATAQPIDPAAESVIDENVLTSDGPDFAGGLEVVKAGSLDLGTDGIATVGDLISYTITVRNVGNVTLTHIAVTDPDADVVVYPGAVDGDNDADIDSLAPGVTATVTATHALTQDDINAGSFANTATASGLDPDNTPVSDTSDSADPADGPGADDPTVTPIPRGPGLSIDKSFTATAGTGEGDTITYSYVVTNTGNVTLTNVTLVDDHTSATGTEELSISSGGVIATLLPGDSVTLTATYVIDQADIDAGDPLTNIVNASGDGPAGTPAATATDNESVDVEASDPSVEVLKTVRSQTGQAAGDTVIFEVTVSNTGNVTLSDIGLTDDLSRTDNTMIVPSPTPAFESGDGGLANQIDVGETWIYTVTYVLTQDDIDAGGIRNSATATADAPDGTGVTDVSDNGAGDGNDPTVVSIPPMPALEAVKTITSSTIVVDETVTFEIAVENTGNVTLTSVNIASDTLTRADGTLLTLVGPSFAGADMGSAAGTLLVGETATYSASYVLTQDDIDAGGIENTATAQGTPPLGSPVSDVSDDNGAGNDPTVLVIPADPIIDFDKRLVSGGPSFDAVGDTLGYEFEITNLGNVTLTAPYDVADPLITDAGGAITCPTTDIAPSGSLICTGSYDVDQDDLDAGQVDNTATATVGNATPVSAVESVPAQQNPALNMLKTPENVDAEDFIVGAVVTYTFTTTNTGNVTITDPIAIDDTLIDSADITCDPFPAAGIAPGDNYICQGDYTVTADDVRIASVTNLATATDGNVTSPISAVTIPNTGTPALEIEKELIASLQPNDDDSGGLTFDEVGDQLEYRFTVTNSGEVSFANDVAVVDTFFADPIVCFEPSSANPDLIPNEVIECTAIYVITQDDLDAGEVLNEAYARTEFGSIPTLVQSLPDDVLTLVDADPMVEIEKDVDRTDYAALGETVTYDFTVTNTGNQTLTNVSVDDPLIPGLVCEADVLAVDAVLTCSATYEITQDDIDRGSLTNEATAAGLDPRGDAIPTVSDDATMTGPSVPPTLDLAKIANPDPFGAVGSPIVYTFEVTNTSIYTMTDITVTDALPGEFIPFTCDISSLAPGAIDRTCQVVITVTQDMVDDGALENTATVAGEDPFGNIANASDTITTDGPDEAPAIMATKLVEVPATAENTVITYSLIVENTGNVSVGPLTVSDTMVRNDGTSLSLDSPFALVSGDTNNDSLINPTETWTYEAPYTIVQADINFGGFLNEATVMGASPSGTVVSDKADDGDDSDGNTEDDPTVVEITTDPVLNVVKTILPNSSFEDNDGNIVPAVVADVGEEIVFEILVANVGNVDILNVSPSDTLTRADGVDITADITGPTATVGGTGTLAPADVWTYEVRYTITQDDVDAGGFSNTASATGEDNLGTRVTDLSDDGDDGDGNISDDPTVLSIPPTPGIETVKTVTEIGTAAGDAAVFEVAVTNTGNVTLSGLAFADTMTNLDGDLIDPSLITVTAPADSVLTVGTTAIYTVSYVLTQADVDAGGLSNTATATGMTPGGLDLSDVSDDGDDSDGNTLDDPTIALIEAEASVLATKAAGVPNRVAPDLTGLTFTMTIENTGNVTLTNLVADDDLQPFVAPATLTQVETPVVTGLTVGGVNTAYDGVSDINMLSDDAELAPGETVTIVLDVQYNTAAGFPEGTNTLVVSSDELPGQAVAVASVSDVAPADVFATKSATPSSVILGGTVTYTLTFTNRLDIQESNLTVIDDLPDGIVYTPGTALVDGVELEPENTGRRLEWTPLVLAPNATITITFNARIASGDVGEYVNRAYALDPGGNVVSNVATATVTRRPEAVFDCADVIGKVFDDRNQNGYQDGIEEDRAAITVQDYFSDKFERPEGPRGEPGLPGVRLATVDGTLITTDEFGRFSVPCAELPAGIGSNFQLKLDDRTLPSGYHVTTENPRNVRVTPGRMTRLNFGATLSNLVEIDLTAAAFDGAAPNAALAGYVTTIVAELEAKPSVLRLTYYRGSEDQRAANARLDALEDAIRAVWERGDRYRLTVERTIHRVQ